MNRRKFSRRFKFMLNTATVASVFTVIACVGALEANNGSWIPVWVAFGAAVLFIATEWIKEREQ